MLVWRKYGGNKPLQRDINRASHFIHLDHGVMIHNVTWQYYHGWSQPPCATLSGRVAYLKNISQRIFAI